MKNLKQQFNQAYKQRKVYKSLSFLDDYLSKVRGPVLDFGSGRGEIAFFLAERGLKVDAVDFSEEAFKQRLKHKNIQYVFGNENDIPNKRYNFILLKLVIAFIKDKEKLFRIFHKRLDGTLLIVTPILRKNYTAHEHLISIDQKILEKLLSSHFSFEAIHREYAGKRLEVFYYLCRKLLPKKV